MTEANCKDEDPELFFPEKGETAKGNQAIMICFACPVRKECDSYRERTGTEYGIWAGSFTKRGPKK